MCSWKYWHLTVRGLAIGLSILLLTGNLSVYSVENHWQGLFSQAKQQYIQADYRRTIEILKQLLSFLDREAENRELRGKIYLLMGAAYEKVGSPAVARENFRRAREISADLTVEDIDLESSVEYRRIVRGVRNPQQVKVIERPAPKPKKKRVSPLVIAAAVLVVGGIVAALLLQKKKNNDVPEIEEVPDYDTNVLGIEWVRIPAGEFQMGDNFDEGEADERPVHTVYLSTYHISRYEITFKQYDTFCEETNRPKPQDDGWGRGSRPVINVSWDYARAFCSWLSKKTGKSILLPTEAQWEKAARGTDQRRYPWGHSAPDCSRANHCCGTQTRPVGSYPAGVSPYGLHDMAGNVAEWCQDLYDPTYYGHSPSRDPEGPGTQNERYAFQESVVRGGSFRCPAAGAASVRAADRGHRNQYSSYYDNNPLVFNDVGFRIVLKTN